jgi:hypothetical protein
MIDDKFGGYATGLPAARPRLTSASKHRPALMPSGFLLISVGKLENRSLGEWSSDEL